MAGPPGRQVINRLQADPMRKTDNRLRTAAGAKTRRARPVSKGNNPGPDRDARMGRPTDSSPAVPADHERGGVARAVQETRMMMASPDWRSGALQVPPRLLVRGPC